MAADSVFLTPDGVANAEFESKRRGYDPTAVRKHLTSAAWTVTELESQLAKLTTKVETLTVDVKKAEEVAANASQDPLELDDDVLAERIGHDAARVLSEARTAASDKIDEAEKQAEAIIAKAEAVFAVRSQEADEEATRIRRKAGLDAQQRAEEASEEAAEIVAAASTDIEHAKSLVSLDRASADVEASRLVKEAETARRHILEDLARRRSAARRQIEQLRAGRERLLASHETVRRALDEITNELNISMSEARAAAEVAGFSVSDTTIDELEAEIEQARLTGLLAPAQVSPALPRSSSANTKSSAPAAEAGQVVDQDGDTEEVDAEQLDTAVVAAQVDEDTAPKAVASDDAPVANDDKNDAGDDELAVVVDLSSARPEVDTESHPAKGRGAPRPKAKASPNSDTPANEIFASLRAPEAAKDSEAKKSTKKQSGASTAKKNGPSKRKPKSKNPAHHAPATSIDEVAAAGLARRLKRVLADEQSRVMSQLKNADEMPALETLLKPLSDHRNSYWNEVLDQTDDADSLTAEASTAVDEVVEMIRHRVGSAITDAGTDTESAVTSMRSIYREIKTQQIVPAANVICTKKLAQA